MVLPPIDLEGVRSQSPLRSNKVTDNGDQLVGRTNDVLMGIPRHGLHFFSAIVCPVAVRHAPCDRL